MDDSTLLSKLKEGNNKSFDNLYRHYFEYTSSYILRNHGSREDAEDVFQDAIAVLLGKVKQDDFVLTSSLRTYLFAISKNIWLKKLRAQKNGIVGNIEDYDEKVMSYPFDMDTEETQTQSVAIWLTKVTEHCQRILDAIFFHNESMDSLLRKMGWKNKHTGANQQYKCIQQMKRERDKAHKIRG